ncbi:superinfection immunity protein [Pseudomonas putida]|nr:superinfection immunity protein [Pseudomonas putida]
MEFLTGSYILLAAVSFFLYVLPMMIAFHRHHENYTVIFLVNLLLGWTVIAWIVCLIWAFVGRPKFYSSSEPTAASLSRYQELEKISELRSSGVLSTEEFEREKSRILK